MALTPGESDRLLLHLQALLAQARRDRGLLLNAPESTALIADAVCEWARDGLDLETVRTRAQRLLSAADVLPGVPGIVTEVRVEARFNDGTRLVVVPNPFEVAASDDPDASTAPASSDSLTITNEADVAIGLTSHIHLAEVNPRLRLDRAAAFGMRLAVPTGDTVWVRPQEVVDLPVCAISGGRVQIGTSGLVDGPLDDPATRDRALALLRSCGYLDVVDGQSVGDLEGADEAVARVMQARATNDRGSDS